MAKKTTKKVADGRLKRSEKSRMAIVSAMLELIREGISFPTADQISERAGVSRRLVFHHFKDIDSIHKELSELIFLSVEPLLRKEIHRKGSFNTRIKAFVEHRAELLELITPTRKTSSTLELSYKKSRISLQQFRKLKRELVSSIFAKELEQFKGKEKKERTSALQATASWSNWHSLRDHQGLSIEEARDVLKRMIRVILVK